MSSGPVIELGELRHEPEPEALPRPPRAAGRPLRAALVLLLVLATVAAGAPARRRDMVVVPARLGAEALVTGDLIVVTDPVSPQGRQRRLSAYRMAGGALAWETALPVEGRYWGMSTLGGTLLVTGYQGTPDGRGSVTIALDRETGAQRWQQPGSPIPLVDGGVLLESGDDEQGRVLRAVDPCCGREGWRVDLPPGQLAYRFDDAGADRLVYSDPGGRVEVRDALTGAVRATADLWGPTDGPAFGVQVIGDLLLVTGGYPATVTGYDLARLERRWRTRVDGALYGSDCGTVICLQGRSGGLQVLDAATGRRLWADDRWAGVWTSGGRLVASAVSSAGPGAEQLAVLDPPTGTVLGELGRWEQAWPSRLGDALIGLRRHPGGGLLVAELDAATGTTRLLDVLPDAAGDCQTSGDRLICRRMDGSYGLWRLRR